jgi:uncharacterized membrane protein (UPF0182 family)
MPNPADMPTFDQEAMGNALRRTGRTGRVLAILAGILVLLLASVGPYTDWQWYSHDLGSVQIPRTSYQWQGILFLSSFVLVLGWLTFNLRLAGRQTLVYDPEPLSPAQAPAAMILRTADRFAPKVRFWLALLLAFGTASNFGESWPKLLLAINGVSFGQKDPAFGLDLSFYIFRMPWYEELVSFGLWVVGLTWFLCFTNYELFRALAVAANAETAASQRSRHLYILGSLFLMLIAVRTQIGIWSLVYQPGTQFTGAGKAVWSTVGVRQVMVGITVIFALVMLFGRRFSAVRIPWAVPAAVVLTWILLVEGTATITQRFVVDPNRLNAESPFAKRAIEMTRFGYGLTTEQFSDQQITPELRPNQAAVAASQGTLDNMRLWDPEVMRQAFDQLQSQRSYYRFHDVDVDRYEINGKERLVMLSPRDIHVDGLPPAAQNWTNTRLRYTHGYGVAIARVDASTSEGEPSMLVEGIPLRDKGIKVENPRIYFSDFRDDFGQPTDEPVIVDTDEPELDYESASGTTTHAWTGGRGIPIGNLLAKTMFAINMKDGNLLVSSNIQKQSRLLLHRNVVDRASKAYPYLKFDMDPYLVTAGGKLVWIIDAYVTSDRLPYSWILGGQNGAINYIRNAAKITVDAYTGEVQAYAINLQEPITATYQKIYPGAFKPLSELPEPLRRHLRYPEDMLSAQATVLTQYHITDPRIFLSNSDVWQIANEIGTTGARQQIRPFYVIIALPEETDAKFTLIMPFSPSGKPNMSGWMAARVDEIGKSDLKLFRFKGQLPPGPELMESKFASSPDIANINRQFNNDQSEIIVGNSLVIPLGNSFLYAESLFLKSRTPGIQVTPRLTKVILALADRIVVKDTYQEALTALFAGELPSSTTASKPSTTTAPATVPSGSGRLVSPAEIKSAADLLDQADAALKSGDFARYGDLQKQVKSKLRELAERR